MADDSGVVRALVRLELESAGYSVVEAVDGQQAVDVALTGDVAVVLLDVDMPVLDGYGAIAALKADHRTSDLPVVFLTGRTDTEDVVEALRLGAHDYLRKPPAPAELLARVRAAVEVTALRQELRRQAAELDRQTRTDHLTRLSNRRHLEDQGQQLLSSSRRYGFPVTVLLADVDHFKRVNDTAGHPAGDAVLQELARRMAAVVRDDDVLGRWGGEEFLVLAPGTDGDGARILAERLRTVVSAHPVQTEAGPVAVTISLGGVACDAPGYAQLFELAVRTADRNLYQAKAEGRDRSHVTGPDADPV